MVRSGSSCPCGSGGTYGGCCGRFQACEAWPATPEELMRSRYSAFAVGAADHLYRTWHPRTRPAEVALDEGLVWTGLDILNVGPDTVEFVAHYLTPGGAGELREVSRFEERARRWFYVGPA